MRILLASFLTFVAIHLSTLSVNAKESGLVYVQLVYESYDDKEKKYHNLRQWKYRAFKERDECENDLMEQMKKVDDSFFEGAEAEFHIGKLIVSNYGGIMVVRCTQIYPVLLEDLLSGGS